MRHSDLFNSRHINMAKIYRLLAVGFFFVISLGVIAQPQDPVKAIKEMKEGYLIVRFPAFKNKIDTLHAMISTAEDPAKTRLNKLLAEALYERDSVRLDYLDAFKNHYNFSNVIWFYDFESKNLETAHYYLPDGRGTSIKGIRGYPKFYLLFDRTEDSKIDAMVITDEKMRPVPRPFPNNFSRGGLSFLFNKLSADDFPEWRVKKMNKKLHKFWSAVN